MRFADDILYKSSKPYPKIKVEKENKRYANILLHSYSGLVSELSAVNQYIFHKIMLNEEYPHIAYIMQEISIVEMHHLDILGKLILKLGVEPKYWINRKNKYYYWDGKYVDYGCNLKEYIAYDIQSEITAIKHYKEAIEDIKDVYIQVILKRIIEDEKIHLKIFRDIQNNCIKKQ